MGMVNKHGPMVLLMKANIAVGKLTDKVNISNLVGRPTMASGSMMSNMAKVQKPGEMVPNTKENISWVISTGQECTNGLTDLAITAFGTTE